MKKISFVVGSDYQNNRIFDLSNPYLNRDNCLYPLTLLKNAFFEKGYDLQTSDLLPEDEADIVLYNEMPKPFHEDIVSEKSFLMLFETELIRKDNWDFKKHKSFKKIFTWNDSLVDNHKYFKINFANNLELCQIGLESRDKLVTLISGNKSSHHPKELYSKRFESIRWFERNHPNDFTYFGMGWEFSINVWWQKVLKKLKLLSFAPKNTSPCYGGRVKEKKETLRKFKFAICFENATGFDGYITEKIFDCFFAGTIPIYWGPSNIKEHIPSNCFIDYTQFKSFDEMYVYLINLSDAEIIQFQNNINEFLSSEKAIPFSGEWFAKTIVEEVLSE